jgi:hypothetical protein
MVDLAQIRAELVAALDGVSATFNGDPITLSAHPVQPHPIAVWDVWPTWQTARPVTMCLAETDWQTCVALPGGDPMSTVAAGDALIDPVATALAAYQITTIAPGQVIVADGGNVPVLIFNVTN